MTKYFLYARKSTEDEERQVMSIEAQLAELQEYAKRENILISETFIESKSAKKPGREIFNEMMAKVSLSKEPIGLIAWHPDRLARNSIDGGQIIYSIDISKIVSLRFPTFWFEPTPQGLFMLQVAFGQSKYYSDNLVENVNRGIRQKLRRGEWLNLAPFGYVNNPKTRNIEHHPTKAKVVRLAFDEFVKGEHRFESLAKFLAEYGVTTRHGTPLAKASIQRMLSNVAYIGLVKHKGETHDGCFPPIVPLQLFEAVQKILKRRARPRKSNKRHDFPFTGLLTCGECGGGITAQWATGKCGGRYRYYRCTKKKGPCAQGYLREELLAAQLRAQLQKVALCDDVVEKMLAKVKEWERDLSLSSQSAARNLETEMEECEHKIDKLVSAYIDGDIPKESYFAKKEELMKTKLALEARKRDSGQQGTYWIEPLREWILDTKNATFVASSENLSEICAFVRKIGTNPILHNKSVTFSFAPPWNSVSHHKAISASRAPARVGALSKPPQESFNLWTILSDARTYFENKG